jgi:hypothetical protein
MLRLFVCLLPLLAAQAQHHGAPPSEKPVALLPGLGTWTHPIATRNPEAQKFFDQGLNLLYGFNRYEALRSFRKAAELDPSAAMPLWGVAMAAGPHINMDMDGDADMKKSCEAATSAAAVQHAPQHERMYAAAVAARCPGYAPEKYVEAMRALAARYPDDLDALTLLAESLMIPVRWRWYAASGEPAPGTRDAERALETVLRRYPDHPGANHFYIHAVESSPWPERAIASAQRLMGIVPAAGHLVHMPGHIWLVLGDYETAATVNERAAQVDREYLSRTGVVSSYAGYYVHNLHFVAYARQMQGRAADALSAADTVAAAVAPHIEAMPEMVDAFACMPVFARLRFNLWPELLTMPQPDRRLPMNTIMWRFGRAIALAASGDNAGAVREKGEFEVLRQKVPAAGMWGNNKAAEVTALASQILEARTAASPAAAVPHWERAVALQDALVYDEPPAWYYPVRESLGAALLQVRISRWRCFACL